MSEKRFFESNVEEAALLWLEELGYQIMNGPEIGTEGDYPLRDSYFDVVLKEKLNEALYLINAHLPDEAIEDAFRQITIPKEVGLIENNKTFHKMINNGIAVSYRNNSGSIKHDRVKLFDFENIDNNDFMAVNQFTVLEGQREKRPDIVIFVNGLPLAVFELKTASDENITIDSAFNQIKTYQEQISSLFVYNAFNVISDGIHARVGTLTSNKDWYMTWRTMDGETVAPNSVPQLEVVIKGMFDKSRFLDIIKQFILFQRDGNEYRKILAGYHQYHAVNAAVESTFNATAIDGDKRIGVVWHTQGSGKSLTMAFYAGKLVISKELSNPTIIVITDRNDLDDQLFSTFAKSSDLLRTNPIQADSKEHLSEQLNGRT